MTGPITQSSNTATECLGYRPDINTFSNGDVELLISLIIDYVTKDLNPNYDPVTEHPALKYDIVAIHSNYGGDASAWHSDDEMFFSWHRDYIRGLEEYLLDRGYAQFVPLPAWNPINAIPDPFLEPEAMVEEVYNTPFVYLDSDGEVSSVFEMPLQQVQPGALEMYTVDDMTCSQFPDMDEFAGFIRANDALGFTSHNSVHGAVNGAMIEVQTASAAAIFWLFHAYVDEIYYCYQTRCDTNVVFHASEGMVDKVVREASSGAISFEPFPDNTVDVDDSGASNICSEDTGLDGQYSLENCPLPTGNSDIEVFPDPDPVFSGVQENVSIDDVIRIQRHLLGVTPFDSPYQYVAADVNNSGSVTTLDMIGVARIILGIETQFPGVSSWRYIPKYALSNNAFNTDFHNDPFAAVWNHPNGQQYPYSAGQGAKSYLEALDLNMLSTDVFYENTWSFRGVKAGNVNLREGNGNLAPGASGFSYDPHSTIPAGTEFSVNVAISGAQKDIYGYQFGAWYDESALEVVGFDRGDLASFSPANFSISSNAAGGAVRTLWYGSGANGEPAYFSLSSNETSLFKVVLKAKTNISKLEDVISLSEEALSPYFFDNDGDTHPVSLKLAVEPGSTLKHLLRNLYPNPFSNQVTFEVQSSQAVPVTLELQDQFGQLVTINGTTTVGIHSHTFTQLSTLQDGTLFYRITAGSEVMTGYVIKQ